MTNEAATVATTDGAQEALKPENKLIQVTGPETDAAAAKAAEDDAAAKASAAAEEAKASVEKVPDWAQKRWDQSEFEKREVKREAKRLAAENAALAAALEAAKKAPGADPAASATDVVPKAEFEKRVAEEAERRQRETAERQSSEAAERQFNADSNTTYEAGKKAFGEEFDAALQNIGRLGVGRDILEIAYATDQPAQVLFELGRDPNKAASILALSPAKMAVEFSKLAMQPGKPAPKTVSSAPPPSKPLSGAAQVSSEPRDEDSDAEWFAKRRAQKRAGGR